MQAFAQYVESRFTAWSGTHGESMEREGQWWVVVPVVGGWPRTYEVHPGDEGNANGSTLTFVEV